MTTQKKLITEEIRNEILARSLTAASSDEVTQSILDVILDAGIDWRAVSVEEVKPVLTDALRAYSRRSPRSGGPMAV